MNETNKGNEKMNIAYAIIGRSINGISLNGCEWILNENGDLQLFPCKEKAVEFLCRHGISGKTLDLLSFCYLTDCPICEEEIVINEWDAKLDGEIFKVKKAPCGHVFNAKLNLKGDFFNEEKRKKREENNKGRDYYSFKQCQKKRVLG